MSEFFTPSHEQMSPEQYAETWYGALIETQTQSPEHAVAMSFFDTLTPALYDDEMTRECMLSGVVLDSGVDTEKGPWVNLKVLIHEMITRDPENAAHEAETRAFSQTMLEADAYPKDEAGNNLLIINLDEKPPAEPGQMITENLALPEDPLTLFLQESYVMALSTTGLYDRQGNPINPEH